MKNIARSTIRLATIACLAAACWHAPHPVLATQAEPCGRNLGTIYNNDINNIIWRIGMSKEPATAEVYRRYVQRILDGKPGVLAQCVGFPEGVLYPTKVDTNMAKHWVELCQKTWPEADQSGYVAQIDVLNKLFESGADPLAITIDVCRRRGVRIVASYRMNAEDLYANTWMLSDFGRAHPEWRIAGAGCLDPAVPEVFEHRLKILDELLTNYDVDGIELDFRRWYHMVSDPLNNHEVLTRMVRQTRALLDEAARRKGRKRLLLGARVGPLLEGTFDKADFPGAEYGEPINMSCQGLGLDVKTWVDDGLVDYLCPATFSPLGLPRTREFVELAKGTGVGVYPTLSQWPCGATAAPIIGQSDNAQTQRRHRDDVCTEALRCYDDGADGVSLFNWFQHHYPPRAKDQFDSGTKREWSTTYTADMNIPALGFGWVEQEIMPALADPTTLRKLLNEPRR
ncbi:MAG: family 10 glycosylhydrolase [Pirellulales bacterium]|nr:family 10 glycosylhydrolase [Pirellulales bacterium]